MATVDKAFRIKNGLVVEGSIATVDGHDVLKKSTEDDNYIIGLIGGTATSENTPNTVVKRDGDGKFTATEITADLIGDVTGQVSNISNHSTSNLTEGSRLYFTDQRALDATASAYDVSGAAAAAQTNAEDYADGLAVNYDPAGEAQGVQDNLDTHTEASSGVHGVNGDVVGTSDTQDISNKRVIDTLYFTDGVTVANEGEIAVKPTTHQFEIKANYGNLDLKTAAAGANVAISASDGDIVLDAGSVSISATEPSGEIPALARAGSTQDILVFAYVPSYPEVFFDTVNTETGPVEIGIISSEVVGDEYIVTAGATGVLFVVGQSYTINTYSANSSWSFDSNGTLYGPAMGGVKVTTLFTDYIISIEDNNLYFASNSNIILNADADSYLGSVSTGNQIATHEYVDNAIAGLDWKTAVNLFATSNVALTGLTETLVIDGHPALDSADNNIYRLLLTGQSVSSQNGIYLYTDNGSTYILVRTSDADEYQELDGAAVFVKEGTQYGGTSWVQNNHYLTSFDGQVWTQFSGSGTVTAGDGITVNGLEVSVNRITVDTWYDPAGAAAAAQTNAEGYADGLAVNYDPAGAAAAAQTNAEDYADGLAVNYDPAGAAAAAQTNAEGYADGLAVNYDPAGAAAAAQTNAEGYADGLVDDIKDGTTTFTQIALTDALIGTATTSLSTTSATVVDSWSAATYSSAKYLVQMKNGIDIEVLEVLVTVDGNNNVYITEYADVISNNQLGTTDADLSGGNVRLLVTSTNGTTVKVHKTLIEA